MMLTRGEVDTRLSTSYRLRELASGADESNRKSDVVIEIVRSPDSLVVVLPATAVA